MANRFSIQSTNHNLKCWYISQKCLDSGFDTDTTECGGLKIVVLV